MRRRTTSFHGKIILYSFFLSLIFHLIALLIKITSPLPEDKPIAKKREKRIRLVVKKKSDKNQIVTTKKKKETTPPPNSSFLGESNQSFDRQTTAKKIAPFKEAGKGAKSGLSTPIRQASPEQNQKISKKFKLQGKQLSFQDLNIKPMDTKAIQQVLDQGSEGIQNGNPEKTGLAQNNDYIEDIPLGDVTNLNTVEYKYYGFFNRIKKKLERYWGKSLREKARSMYRKGRRIPANTLRITSLIISLDSRGNVVNVTIKGTSGIQEFDDAALESFNKAGPFPNPPRNMIKEGAAHIEWGFVVKG